MKTIVLASQKGGAGKTTLAAHLAVAAEEAGQGPVAMVDTDPQGTLRTWWEKRQAPSPAMADIPLKTLAKQLGDLRTRGVKLAIIDTPPAITAAIQVVIQVADLVVMPVKPSPADLWAVRATLDLCQAQNRPYVFVVSQATRGALLTVQAVAALSAYGQVATSVIHHRVGFAGAFASGQTIGEFEQRSGGAGEVRDLLTFILERLNESKQAGKKEVMLGN